MSFIKNDCCGLSPPFYITIRYKCTYRYTYACRYYKVLQKGGATPWVEMPKPKIDFK